MIAKHVGVALVAGIIVLVSTNYVASQQPKKKAEPSRNAFDALEKLVTSQRTSKKTDQGKSREVDRYIQLLEDPNPMVRKQAAIALGDISRSISKGTQSAITDENADVRAAVAEALETNNKLTDTRQTTRLVTCQTCKGTGQYNEKCVRCKGTGEEKCLGCNGSGKDKDFSGKEINCYGCKGTGKNTCGYFACRGAGSYKEQCPECHGSGKTTSR